jgi:benzoyl-CoA reductase/2-hydroxyglutaryl-CoA dehydratase subunit BcrC/BadD/HgdB
VFLSEKIKYCNKLKMADLSINSPSLKGMQKWYKHLMECSGHLLIKYASKSFDKKGKVEVEKYIETLDFVIEKNKELAGKLTGDNKRDIQINIIHLEKLKELFSFIKTKNDESTEGGIISDGRKCKSKKSRTRKSKSRKSRSMKRKSRKNKYYSC